MFRLVEVGWFPITYELSVDTWARLAIFANVVPNHVLMETCRPGGMCCVVPSVSLLRTVHVMGRQSRLNACLTFSWPDKLLPTMKPCSYSSRELVIMSCKLEEGHCVGAQYDQGQAMAWCILATGWSLSMRFRSDPSFSNSINSDLKLAWPVSVVCVRNIT
jgi:hypothetical protein